MLLNSVTELIIFEKRDFGCIFVNSERRFSQGVTKPDQFLQYVQSTDLDRWSDDNVMVLIEQLPVKRFSASLQPSYEIRHPSIDKTLDVLDDGSTPVIRVRDWQDRKCFGKKSF